MNPTVAKYLVKGVFGLGVSSVIGIMIKMEHRVDDRIDEHYDSKKQDPKESTT